GITIEEIAIIYTVLPFVAVIGSPIAGFIADKIGNYKPVGTWSFDESPSQLTRFNPTGAVLLACHHYYHLLRVDVYSECGRSSTVSNVSGTTRVKYQLNICSSPEGEKRHLWVFWLYFIIRIIFAI